MLAFVIRRIVQAAAVLFAVSLVTFGLFYAAPSDPARIACGPKCDAGQIAAVEKSMGLSEPLATQYVTYLTGLVAGRDITDVDGTTVIDCSAPCLGYSYFMQEPVTDAIADRFPVTLSLTLGTVALVIVLGMGTGFITAIKRRTWVDRWLSTFTLIGASVQLYFIGYIAQYYLAFQSSLFPKPAYVPFTEDPAGWFAGMLLPWLCLGIVSAAMYARLARSQMLETMGEGFIRTARAKGMSTWRTHLKYTSRGTAAPMVQLLGLEIGFTLSGAVIAETVFGLNGIGKLSVDAILQNDLPTIVGTVMVAAFIVVLFIAVADFFIALLDPRVRLS